jgi:hypothetical protein
MDVQTARISSSFLHNLHGYQMAAAAAAAVIATVNVLNFRPLHETNILFVTYYHTKQKNQNKIKNLPGLPLLLHESRMC